MKLACCFGEDSTVSAAVAGKMADAMRGREWHRCEQLPAGSGAAACVHTSERASPIPLLHRRQNGNWLAVSGWPVCLGGDLATRLASAAGADYRSAARTLAELDGPFAAIMWDIAARKLLVVCDFLGMQPLYVAQAGRTLLLASEIRGIAASGLVEIRMDPAGWGSFVAFGHTIADATQLAGVRRVEPGATIVYDPATGTMESSPYWRWPAPRPDLTAKDVDTAKIVEAYKQEMGRYAEYVGGGTVLLSGGLDSRFITALLCQMDIPVSALVVSHGDHFFNADGRYGIKVARILGVRDARLVDPPADFYNSADYLRYMLANEVATSSYALFIAQVASYVREDMLAVWEGCFPQVSLRPVYRTALRDFDEYLQTACRSRRNSPPWRAAERVFATPLAEQMHDGFMAMLQQERSRYSDDGFGIAEFFVRNRTRNRIAPNPLKVYANSVLAFTPGFTKANFELTAPFSQNSRRDHALLRLILQRHLPGTMKLPFLSGGQLLKHRALAPSVWAGRAAFNALHYWRRARRLPWVGPAVRAVDNWVRRRPSVPRAGLLDAVIARVDESHGDLNAASVAALKAARPPYDRPTAAAREMLFYWQVWRWVMEGKLTAATIGEVHSGLMGV